MTERRARVVRAWTIAFVAAVIVAVIGVVADARQTAAMFLVAYLAAVSVALGALTMVMIAHVTTSTWFVVLRRRAEIVLGALPALAAMGVLVLFSLPLLYPWVGVPSSARANMGPAAYLNVPFFIVRAVIYWAVWIALAEALRATARLQERGDTVRAARRFRNLSGGGLVALAVTMTFASFDWMMSLTPTWYSTIYGAYWFAGGMVGALALIAILGAVARERGTVTILSTDHFHALAKLLLTFVLLWLYMGFAQYIVIWSANVPREVTWYVARTRGAWGGVALILVFMHFGLPFLLLLSQIVKRSTYAVAAIAALLLALHYLDTLWVILPALAPVTWWAIVLGAATLVVVVLPSAALAAWRHRGEPEIAEHDPLLPASVQYRAQ